MSSLNLNDLMTAANRAHAEGRFGDCERLCKGILSKLPENVPALVLAGVAALKREKSSQAISYLEQAVRVDRNCIPGFQWLSMAHRKEGAVLQALAAAEHVVSKSPQDPLALHQLGLCQIDAGQYQAAEASFRRASVMAPQVSIIQHGLGLAQQALGRNSEATASFRRACRLDPTLLESQTALRQRLLEDGDAEAAISVAEAIVSLQPQSSEAHVWVARAMLEAQRANDAAQYIQRAIALEPDSPVAHSLLGAVFQVRGELAAAESEFQKSLSIQPDQGATYLGLVTNRRLTEKDRDLVDQMHRVASDQTLAIAEQSSLHYALGKAHEDLGEYHEAMLNWEEGNALAYRHKFGDQVFDRNSLDNMDAFRHVFTREFFASRQEFGSATTLPIFVVGMIRSGTTLVEQILSSHPQVGAAGEQRFWLENARAAISGKGIQVDVAMLGRLADRFEQHLKALVPGKDRIVDKMPMNYQLLGLLFAAYPKCKVIHIRRHPVDTCLSIFATPNRNRLRWAHNKANIALAYQKYLDQMATWRTALPDKCLLELDYEDLVKQPDGVTRQLISFCDLDWDDSCLRPERNERTVVTPSVWQVRQPVYQTSVSRWRRFEPWLGPLAKLNTNA